MKKKKIFNALMIEPTNICNLKCPICIAGSDSDKRKRGMMRFCNFKKLVNGLNNLKYVYLWGWGEPFLNPEINKIISCLGEKGIFIDIHTNGTIINNKIIKCLKNNYKIQISFSIDGVSQKSYSDYRRGGDFRKVINNIKKLIKAKKKYHLFNVKIIWQYLITKNNEEYILNAKKIAKKIGVDILKFKLISINAKHKEYSNYIPKKIKYRRHDNRNNYLSKKCMFLAEGCPVVSWEGKVTPCCYDYYEQYLMGDALKEGIVNIWNKNKYKKFREECKKGVNDLCSSKCRFNKSINSIYKEIITIK